MTQLKHNFVALCAICLMVLGFTFQACTGYDDGPAISFRNEEIKLANTWRIQDASLRGIEITAEYDGDFYRFKEEGDFERLDAAKLISVPPFTQDTIVTESGIGSWQFLKDNKLEILYSYIIPDPYDSDISYTEEYYEVWEIDRLTPEELWLRNDSLTFKMGIFE